MKNLPILSLLFFLTFMISSCHRNRLKTSEKELGKKILLNEKETAEAERALREKQLSDTLNRPKSFRYKEDRYVDPAKPLVVIDIAGNLNNIKEINLTDVASEIKYIRMEQPPDSAFRKDIGFTYHLTDNYIIASNTFGMLQYNKDGRFVNQIVKNEFTGIEVYPKMVVGYSESTFIGAMGANPRIVGNKLYYLYSNDISQQAYLMEYDCSEAQLSQTLKYDPENPLKIIGQGQIIVDLNHGKVMSAPPQRSKGGKWSRSNDNINQTIGLNWIDDNTYTKKLKGKLMMGIFNKEGDTLATFAQHEKLINYTKSLQRGTDNGIQYEFKGRSFYRNAFNDTVYQIIPPNRLLPVYVINLGNYKVTRQQGVDPGFDLTGKIIPEDFIETPEYIFFEFTKDNYDCIANRQSKKVKIYYALYSKINHQLSVIKGDPYNYSPEIIENNIDGGIPVWPLSYMIGKNGEIMISLKGKDLKDRVKSKEFRLSKAPESKKKELENLAGIVTSSEDILMIIK